MGGLHRPEVALVECGHLRLVETLGERDDAGIHDSQGQVDIARLQLAAASQISPDRRLDAVGAGQDVVEEDQPSVARQSACAPVVELGKDKGWHDEILVRAGQQSGTARMVRICRVERGEQRTGVADERHSSARLVGHGPGGELGRAPPVGGARDSYPRAAPTPQRACLLLHGLAQERRKRNAPSLRLRLKGAKDGRRRADSSTSEVSHDVRC